MSIRVLICLIVDICVVVVCQIYLKCTGAVDLALKMNTFLCSRAETFLTNLIKVYLFKSSF